MVTRLERGFSGKDTFFLRVIVPLEGKRYLLLRPELPLDLLPQSQTSPNAFFFSQFFPSLIETIANNKMKTAVLASLIASAAAFAPAQQSARSSVAVSASFEGELGVQPPLGFWDPLGLLDDGSQETFDRLRFVELKHGRISMLAVLGYLVAESGTRLPGDIDFSGTSFESIPNGFAALSAMPAAGLAPMMPATSRIQSPALSPRPTMP